MSTRALAQEKKIKDLQREITEMEDTQAEQDTALLLATQFQKRAHEERLNLKDIISNRDARIATVSEQLVEARASTSTLTAMIYAMTHAASWDLKTGAALEAQAQVHLTLVQNMKTRMTKLEEDGSRAQLDNEGVRKDLANALGELQQLRADAASHGERTLKEKRTMEAAIAKAAEFQQIAQDQQALIKRLLVKDS
ncbi:hypothetical protein LTR86_005113 [Recurvomyces mirabilis]|nr:hypothetical protein LTR86_005113 [Recurvomyces mirabilis]